MMNLPMDSVEAQVNELVNEYAEKNGAALGECYRLLFVNRLIRCAQGLA